MKAKCRFLQWLVALLMILFLHPFASQNSASAAICEFSFLEKNKLYNYTLTSSTRQFPRGVLSEDGFYKVAVNDTILWFQLCDEMIFNHDPPRCVDCGDCGGPTRCGMRCSALVSNNIGGYHACTALGRGSNLDVDVIEYVDAYNAASMLDKKNPHIGVVVKMSSSDPKFKCSLSVSVLCNYYGVEGPWSLKRVGICDYATELKHPSACAMIIHVNGRGWGWFGILITIILSLFGAYLVAGIVYRFLVLGVRGVDVIPNLEFWTSLPQRTRNYWASLVRKFTGPSEGYRSSYSPVNF